MRKQETWWGQLAAGREESRKGLESWGTWNEGTKNLGNWYETTWNLVLNHQEYNQSNQTFHGRVYSIQHHVIKFVSDLQQFGAFTRVLLFPPLNWLPRCSWNIAESGIKQHNHNHDPHYFFQIHKIGIFNEYLIMSLKTT
jgi:hypothetical protein